MNRLCDYFPTCSTLALDQNGGSTGRNLRNQVENTQHRFALAHDVRETVALFERALQLQVLFLGAMAGNSRTNVGHQLFVVPWLLDKVLRACAYGFDDIVPGSVGRDHDDRRFRLAFLDLRKQFQPALARQRQVEQDEIEVLDLKN